MKKYLGILLIAGSLVACNNSAETTDNTKDSLDSVDKAKKEMVDSSAEAKKDIIDSTTEAKKDMVDSMNKK